MKPIFDFLEQQGIVSDEDAYKVSLLRADQLERLYRELYSLIFREQYDSATSREGMDPFRYVASASMRGDSTCSSPECRSSKLSFLENFSALYATRVFVPVPLSSPDDIIEFNEYESSNLSQSVFTLLKSRSLIEAEVLVPTVLLTRHCKHDYANVEKLTQVANEYAYGLAKQSASLFTATYQLPEKSPSGRSTVYLEGPNDYLEHEMVYMFDEPPNWKLKSWRYDREGKPLLHGSRKLRFVNRIFESIAGNTTFYLAYGLEQKAKFLSDLVGETVLLEGVGSTITETSATLRQLTHSVPLLFGLSIDQILRIRREDRESFAAYRYEIASVTKEALGQKLSVTDAQEYFQARIAPKLLSIRRELSAERKKTVQQLGFGLAGLAASVAIGACGLPLISAVPLGTVATGLLTKGTQRLFEARPEAQKQDLYFLVRLLEDAN